MGSVSPPFYISRWSDLRTWVHRGRVDAQVRRHGSARRGGQRVGRGDLLLRGGPLIWHARGRESPLPKSPDGPTCGPGYTGGGSMPRSDGTDLRDGASLWSDGGPYCYGTHP